MAIPYLENSFSSLANGTPLIYFPLSTATSREGEWLWQKVQNIHRSLKKTQSGIDWNIRSIALRKCAENLGISESALKKWMKGSKGT